MAKAAAPYLTGPDQGTWLARLDADEANLWRAARHAANCPDRTAHVLRLGCALRRYWEARFRGREALDLLMPVLERPEARSNPELFAAALVTAGYVATRYDPAAARRLGEQGAEFARAHSDERSLIESLKTLCSVYCHAGEPARGLPLGLESIERARRLGDDVVLARSLTTYLAAGELIDPGHRGRLFIEAIACTERSGDRLVSIFLRINAGTHALCAGDVPAARAHFEQAAQTLQAIGGVPGHLVMINLGWVLREERDSDAAWSMFEAALRVSRRTRDREVEAVASVGLACLIADRGGWHQAAELHGAAQAFLDATGQQWEQLDARYRNDNLGEILARLGVAQFNRAYASGAALSLDVAIERAALARRLRQ